MQAWLPPNPVCILFPMNTSIELVWGQGIELEDLMAQIQFLLDYVRSTLLFSNVFSKQISVIWSCSTTEAIRICLTAWARRISQNLRLHQFLPPSTWHFRWISLVSSQEAKWHYFSCCRGWKLCWQRGAFELVKCEWLIQGLNLHSSETNQYLKQKKIKEKKHEWRRGAREKWDSRKRRKI